MPTNHATHPIFCILVATSPGISEIQFDNDMVFNMLARLKTRKVYGCDLQTITPEEMKLVAKEISYNIINISRMSYMLGK